ncbi:hypothetical protein G6F31_014332 [Rhizopus arrhizus]|nr:hypothetical protein G6F31_014332 [Rhizopus arrhizus]
MLFGSVGIFLAAARRSQRIALVRPLVLRGVAAGDAFDTGIERGGGHLRVRVGHRRVGRLDVQGEFHVRPDALAPAVQHGGTGALGQAVDQGHGQRLHAEERHEHTVAGLGLLVGQDAGGTAVLEHLEQLPHGRALGAHLLHVLAAAHDLQESVAGLVLRRLVDDGDLPARGQPLVEQLPVAEVRRSHDHALAAGQRRVVQRFAMALLQVQAQVVGRLLAPQAQGLDGLQRGGAQQLAVQVVARGGIQFGVGQFQVAPGDAALTGVETDPRPRQGARGTPQQRPGQAGEQGGGAGAAIVAGPVHSEARDARPDPTCQPGRRACRRRSGRADRPRPAGAGRHGARRYRGPAAADGRAPAGLPGVRR